jgi:ubiquinol-cytochrome c reductase cytochrome b subunit
VLAIMACAWFLGPIGPGGPPDPTIIQTYPKPDVPFLWIFAVFALLPPHMETAIILIAPVVIIIWMLALPYYAGEGEKHWSRRPIAVLTLVVIVISITIFTRLGQTEPWSPVMNGWSAIGPSQKMLAGRTPLQREGAVVFQNMQCRNCHSIDGRGGSRGPDLSGVSVRMTESQLIRQVLQGGGNMPGFGNSISPQETTALVSFLGTLNGNVHPAEQAADRLLGGPEAAPSATSKASPAEKTLGRRTPAKSEEKNTH